MTDTRAPGGDEAAFIAAARSNDAAPFALITERYRRELQVHCYRMLANYEDAQDMTQETFLRAWNRRESFKGHAALRTWLYRIATNACQDFLQKRNDRTPVPAELPDPRLRSTPRPLRSHDPHRHDRPHDPPPHRREHPHLARHLNLESDRTKRPLMASSSR
ncbi:sigma-70 family RNA polymerase sigma factor [Nonomuraea sp. GTA35]|uniref:sigma-70 family RNA polymerase sigma factor n=1 Tax=Nonomuraea sp. GTA35 TaxID=1676746 RepID=UPI0035C0E1F4